MERTAELNSKIIRLKEELDAERERGLQLWLNLITTADGLNRNVPTRGRPKTEALLALLDVVDSDRARFLSVTRALVH